MDALERSQDANQVRMASLFARLAAGGVAATWDGVTIARSGTPVAAYNVGFVSEAPSSPSTLSELVEQLSGSGAPFRVQVADELAERIGPTLRELGLDEPTEVPGMRLRVARHREPDPPEGVTITTVASLHDHVRFVETVAAGLGHPADAAAEVRPPSILREAGYAEILAVVAGEAVAAACVLRTDDVVGIYDVAVPPPYRRQGLGRAVTAAAVAWGTAQGASTAVLRSSPEAVALYRGMGFRNVRTYRWFPGGPPT